MMSLLCFFQIMTPLGRLSPPFTSRCQASHKFGVGSCYGFNLFNYFHLSAHSVTPACLRWKTVMTDTKKKEESQRDTVGETYVRAWE